ncbi:hypothetical protein PENTCL1PPCAC_20409, partial [Pristionchus entomophagus]
MHPVRLVEHLLSPIDGSEGGVWKLSPMPVKRDREIVVGPADHNGMGDEPQEETAIDVSSLVTAEHVTETAESFTHYENWPPADPDLNVVGPADHNGMGDEPQE